MANWHKRGENARKKHPFLQRNHLYAALPAVTTKTLSVTGNKTLAAKILNLSRSRLYVKMPEAPDIDERAGVRSQFRQWLSLPLYCLQWVCCRSTGSRPARWVVPPRMQTSLLCRNWDKCAYTKQLPPFYFFDAGHNIMYYIHMMLYLIPGNFEGLLWYLDLTLNCLFRFFSMRYLIWLLS